MTEDDAQSWIGRRYGAKAVAQLQLLVDLVRAETANQSLIAASTLDHIWVRHVMDSAQLVPIAPVEGTWLDIGSGAGFPGLVAALLRPARTVLIEPRRLRATFLNHAARTLELHHVEVIVAKVEAVTEQAAVISARAVAPVEKLLHGASGCATTSTRWLLPRGRIGEVEVAALRRRWRGQFHVEQSLTDKGSAILVLDGVYQKSGR